MHLRNQCITKVQATNSSLDEILLFFFCCVNSRLGCTVRQEQYTKAAPTKNSRIFYHCVKKILHDLCNVLIIFVYLLLFINQLGDNMRRKKNMA
jgi:hypothetical protein